MVRQARAAGSRTWREQGAATGRRSRRTFGAGRNRGRCAITNYGVGRSDMVTILAVMLGVGGDPVDPLSWWNLAPLLLFWVGLSAIQWRYRRRPAERGGVLQV